ncbi:MAG: hypothetical protein AAGB31_06255 [Bdellovibrio sp.]
MEYKDYEKEWLIVGDDTVEQALTLAVHFSKKIFEILSADEKSATLYSPEDGTTFKVRFTVVGDKLEICYENNQCRSYGASNRSPDFSSPPTITPAATLSSTWCVDDDCFDMGGNSDTLFNLHQDMATTSSINKYFFEKHNILLKTLHFAYRLENNEDTMKSFSSAFRLYGLHPSNWSLRSRN